MKTKVLLGSIAVAFLAGCVARNTPGEPGASAGRVCEVKITRYEPPAAKKTTLEEVLPPGAVAGNSVSLAGIKVVAVNEPGAPAQTDYLTLDEAIAASLCTVRETGTVTRDAQGNEQVTDGDVNTLLVSNTGQKPIFLMAGDLVLGGKQDRILAAGLIVEPNTKDLPVSVFCVEHGRWTARSGEAQSAAGLFINSATIGQADIAVKKAAVGDKDQSQVWQAVATNNSSLGVSTLSAGGSFRATYDSEEIQKKLDGLMKEAAPLREGKPVGYAVMTDGDVAVMDLFDSTALCGKLSEKLLRSYLITALSGGYTVGGEHPLAPRLRDKVTVKFQKVKLSEAIAALDAAWDVKLEFMTVENDPVVEFAVVDTEVGSVLDALLQRHQFFATVKDAGTVAVCPVLPLVEEVQVQERSSGQQRGRVISGISGRTLSGGARAQTATIRSEQIPPSETPPGSQRDFASSVVPAPPPASAAPATPIQYECKDTKRERTVHRGYMRR